LKIDNSYELLLILRELNLLENKPKYWWPNVGEFEVVIGAILTQNTKWGNVEKALDNLKDFLELDEFLRLDIESIKNAIRVCGFYNQKAIRLYNLVRNIKQSFNSFDNFKNTVSREWLLEQKGIGFESADAILCYCCFRDVFIVDSYSHKLVKSLGFEFDSYLSLQEWFVDGISVNWSSLSDKYENNLNLCYARFHGKIVEYVKGVNSKKICLEEELKNLSLKYDCIK